MIETPGQIKPNSNYMKVATMAEFLAAGKEPEVLFWVGCAGSFDQRAQKNYQSICHHFGKSWCSICNTR